MTFDLYTSVDKNSHSINQAPLTSEHRPRILTPIPRHVPQTRTVNLSSCYTNTRSLVNKLDETEIILAQNACEIVIVSETWLHSDLPDTDINIPQYNLFQKSRQE